MHQHQRLTLVLPVPAPLLGGQRSLLPREQLRETPARPPGRPEQRVILGQRRNHVELLIQGGADENDSVPEGDLVRDSFSSDSYDFDQTMWINSNLGRLPADRVDDVRAIYLGFGMTVLAMPW